MKRALSKANGRRRGDEWAPLYMLIVIVIALILILTLVKPMMKRAAETSAENAGYAQSVAKASLFLIWRRLKR
ncbi:MAG: hypothetical protein WC792_02790 [Candidatus Micrarchaeia archaeon]|jgi:hypothetical protein